MADANAPRAPARPHQSVWPDQVWNDLAERAKNRGMSVGSLLRRLAIAYLEDDGDGPDSHPPGCLSCRLDAVIDPLPDRTATLVQNRGANDA